MSSRASAPSTISGSGRDEGPEWFTLSTALGSPPPGGFRPGAWLVVVGVDVVPLPVVLVRGLPAGGTGVFGVIFVPFFLSSAFAFCSSRRMSSCAL